MNQAFRMFLLALVTTVTVSPTLAEETVNLEELERRLEALKKQEAADKKAADAQGPRLTINISLDSKLASRFDPNATLYVFARATDGPQMPLAIHRASASELPLTVTLDDTMGMTPTMRLSMFEQVVIGARLSSSGNAAPRSGDLHVLSAPIDSHRREPLNLVINSVAP